jgi:hypothetical protein
MDGCRGGKDGSRVTDVVTRRDVGGGLKSEVLTVFSRLSRYRIKLVYGVWSMEYRISLAELEAAV